MYFDNSDIVEHVKQDLREGHKKVIVSVADEERLEKVKEQLKKTGLLQLPNIEVVLRSELDEAVVGS